MEIRITPTSLAVAALSAAVALAAAPASAASVGEGRRIAESRCRQCHSLGALFSPNRSAPTLENLAAPYTALQVRDALAGDGVLEMHPAMPGQRLSGDEADSLIMYLRSIGVRFAASAAKKP